MKLAIVLVFCGIGLVAAEPIRERRHLIAGLIHNTAEKFLKPLGLGGGGSSAQSQSFSLGGSFLGKFGTNNLISTTKHLLFFRPGWKHFKLCVECSFCWWWTSLSWIWRSRSWYRLRQWWNRRKPGIKFCKR